MKQIQPVFKVYRKRGSSPDRSKWEWELLKIHSWTQTDFGILDFNFDNFALGGCGELNVEASGDLGWTYNDRIDITILGELQYSGYVTVIPKDGTEGDYHYLATGFIDQLEWRQIQSYTIETEYVQDAIRRLVNTEILPYTDIEYNGSKLTVTVGDIGTSGNDWNGMVENLEFTWQTPLEILEVLRQMLGAWDFGVDANRELYFYRRNRTVEKRYFVGKGGVLEFTPEETIKNLRNVLHLDVGQLSNGHNYLRDYTDEDSINLYGRREDRMTLPAAFPLYSDIDRIPGSSVTVSNLPSATGLANITDEDPETYFNAVAAQASGQTVRITLPKKYRLGKIEIDSTPPEDEMEGDTTITRHYPRELEASVWESGVQKVIFEGENNQTNLVLTTSPYLTAFIQLRLTGAGENDVQPWRIYGVRAYEMEVSDLDMWAEQWLAERSTPEESAELVLAQLEDIPPARMRVNIHDRNGQIYEYNVARVSYAGNTNSVSVALGERNDTIAPALRDLYRKMIEVDHREDGDTIQHSTGSGYAAGSIPGTAIDGQISANQVKTGSLISRNYSGSAGMMFNLDAAQMIVRQPAGLDIHSPGGVTISGGGSLSMEDGSSVERVYLGNAGGEYALKIKNSAGNVIFDSTDDGGTTPTLAGWDISQWMISANSGEVGMSSEVTGGTDWRFWAGHATPGSAPFRVDENGNMVATSATISGNITATTGSIGGWTIGASTLYNGTDIILDGGNKSISVNDADFGDRGIQIEYNNGNPRMYIGDGSNAGMKFEWTSLRNATYKWTASAGGTNEYYCELAAGGDPSLEMPAGLTIDGVAATKGELGSLAAGNYGYGDNDTLGYMTVYVRLSDGTDPDTKAENYIVSTGFTLGISVIKSEGSEILSDKGSQNIFAGGDAGADTTSGKQNSALGYWGMFQNTTGSYNVGIGYRSLYTNSSGDSNVACGYEALYENSSGEGNTALGLRALYLSNGDRNIGIGNAAGNYETGSDKLFIDNRSRGSEADGRVKALIYGEMADATADQHLYFNSNVYVREELQVGGGYGDTGVTISAAGVIQANGAITTGGELTANSAVIGGGYGSTGVTISSDGFIWANGIIDADDEIRSGVDDTTAGVLRAYSNATGNDGGRLVLHLSGDYDGTIDRYIISANQDDLWIGSDTTSGAIRLTYNAGDYNLSVTAGTIESKKGFIDDGNAGVDGTFTDGSGNTITVSGGIITDLGV